MEQSNLRILVNIDTGELAVEESVTGMINELIYGKEITDQKKIDRYIASEQINVRELIECALADPKNFNENFSCKIHRRIFDCIDSKNLSRIENLERLKHLMGNYFVKTSDDEFINKMRNYFKENDLNYNIDIKDGDIIINKEL